MRTDGRALAASDDGCPNEPRPAARSYGCVQLASPASLPHMTVAAPLRPTDAILMSSRQWCMYVRVRILLTLAYCVRVVLYGIIDHLPLAGRRRYALQIRTRQVPNIRTSLDPFVPGGRHLGSPEGISVATVAFFLSFFFLTATLAIIAAAALYIQVSLNTHALRGPLFD